MIFQYGVKLIFLPVLFLVAKYYLKSISKFVAMLMNSMLFGEILMIFLEAYLELLLASILNLKCEPSDPDCNTINIVISILIAIIVLVVVPISICYVVYKLKSKSGNL
jgi:hypothetical protein